MDIQRRIDLLAKLGSYLNENSPEWQIVKEQAGRENSWFTIPFIDTAIKNICDAFLQKEQLEQWLSLYNAADSFNKKTTVGIVMAGNIPLVGFHDFLCVFASGKRCMIKLSSKDHLLLKYLAGVLSEWDNEITAYITFAEMLKNCDAYIATGSNNSGRYFEYYFGKYPHIIRRNRTSAAVLDGTETKAELEVLADDIQLFFGMGCRNVTKLFTPENYNFIPLLTALRKYDYLIDNHKYKHNYDYYLTLLIMNSKLYMTNESIIITENKSLFSPVSQIHYEVYTDKNILKTILQNNGDIQCVMGHDFIPFGQAQCPSLTDYADGVDTMKFLNNF